VTLRCPDCRREVPESLLEVHDVEITEVRAPGDSVLGFAAVIVGPFRIDGVAVVPGADGRPRISFPRKAGSGGRRYLRVQPLDAALNERIESAVLARFELALRREGRTPS
jgi:hypothetical protein